MAHIVHYPGKSCLFAADRWNGEVCWRRHSLSECLPAISISSTTILTILILITITIHNATITTSLFALTVVERWRWCTREPGARWRSGWLLLRESLRSWRTVLRRPMRGNDLCFLQREIVCSICLLSSACSVRLCKIPPAATTCNFGSECKYTKEKVLNL